MKKVLSLVFLFLLSFSVSALDAQVLDYDPVPAKAGHYVDVFITIENNSKGQTEPIEVEVIPKDGLRLAFGEEAIRNVSPIPTNISRVLDFRFLVVRDAIEGNNIFEVVATEKGKPKATFDLSLQVVNDLPNIEIGSAVSQPRKISPDTDDVELIVDILNIGDGVAENLKATLIVPSELEVSDSFSNVELIGNLAENSSEEATFFIDVPENTPAGEYEAIIVAEYTLEDSSDKNFLRKELPIEIIVKPVPRFEIVDVQTDPAEISAGDDVVMTFTIKNVGEEEGEFVRLRAYPKSEQPLEFDSGFDFVSPNLAPGETAQASLEFSVDADAVVQLYDLELEIKSFVNNEVRLEQEVVRVNVAKASPEAPDLTLLIGAGIVALLIIVAVYLRRINQEKDKKR